MLADCLFHDFLSAATTQLHVTKQRISKGVSPEPRGSSPLTLSGDLEGPFLHLQGLQEALLRLKALLAVAVLRVEILVRGQLPGASSVLEVSQNLMHALGWVL
jgi:hypothetical protein